jgi:pentatricopeptide repeat protein
MLPRSALSLSRKRVATRGIDVQVALYSNGISLLRTLAGPCITICHSGPHSQRPQSHTPPQDRSNRGRTSARAEVERVLGTGKNPGSFWRHPAPSSGTAGFNLKLGRFADIGRYLDVVKTLKEMKGLGLRPDILTYNSAMELFGKRNMEDEAWALLDDMKALGIMPDIETYKFLLQVRTTSPLFGGATET